MNFNQTVRLSVVVDVESDTDDSDDDNNDDDDDDDYYGIHLRAIVTGITLRSIVTAPKLSSNNSLCIDDDDDEEIAADGEYCPSKGNQEEEDNDDDYAVQEPNNVQFLVSGIYVFGQQGRIQGVMDLRYKQLEDDNNDDYTMQEPNNRLGRAIQRFFKSRDRGISTTTIRSIVETRADELLSRDLISVSN